MIFETKLNIGDIVWVPRVYRDTHRDSIVVNGKTYFTSDEDVTVTYRPMAKKLTVAGIDVEIRFTGVTTHYLVDDENNIRRVIFDSTTFFMTKEEALDYAMKMAENKEEYYG